VGGKLAFFAKSGGGTYFGWYWRLIGGITCGELMFAIGGNYCGYVWTSKEGSMFMWEVIPHRPPHPLEGVHLGSLYRVI